MSAISDGEAAAGLFRGDDQTQALFRTLDWSRTALGAVSTWPPELRAAVRTVLPSRLPVLLWWGPDLIQIYNDAVRMLLGDKHPSAAGQPAARCWAEMWEMVGPMVAAVLDGSDASYGEDLPVLTTRSGYLEETYWTFSHSAIIDERSQVRGLFVAVSDVTSKVVLTKRLATVRALSDIAVSEVGTVADACAKAVNVLSQDRDTVPFAVAFLTDGDSLRLAGSYGLNGVPPATVRIDAETGLGRVAASGVSEVVSGLRDRTAIGTIEAAPLGPAIPDGSMIVPLWAGEKDRPAGVVALGLSPYRAYDNGYRALLELVARELSVLISDARAYDVERARAAGLARFYQNVSHELRTPLTLIQGPIHDLLADRTVDLPRRHRSQLLAADRAGAQLRRMVDALLDFSRAEDGMLHADIEPTDLVTLTAGLVSMFRSGAEANNLRLDVQLVLPEEPVDVDRGMWSSIVINLLSNAVKFTAEGTITVGLRPRGDRVELTVSDTGTGIPADQLPLIFQRFHLVPARWRRRRAGIGIGLPLVADLAQALGGAITAASTLGRGSMFTVTVPRGTHRSAASSPRPLETLTGDVTAMVAEAMPTPGTARAPVPLPEPAIGSGVGRTILIVEDHDDMREYLTRLLAEDGWQVQAVADVDRALAAAGVPDVVLSDVMLPGRSGLELVHLLRASSALSEVPVLLLTARAGSGEVAEGLAAGADDYVIKPFQAEELLARVRVHYELSKLRGYALARAQNQVAHLSVALASNRRIGAAIGVLMASRTVTEEQAFGLLRDSSQGANRKLRDVADEVVRTGVLP